MAVATLVVILAVPVVAFLTVDYANYLRYSRDMQHVFDESRRAQDLSLLKICGNYREFQKHPEGKDTHAMDDICNDVETRMYPWVVSPSTKG